MPKAKDSLGKIKNWCETEWLKAGGDPAQLLVAEQRQEDIDNYISGAPQFRVGMDRWKHDHHGMRGGAGHPNRPDEPDLLGK